MRFIVLLIFIVIDGLASNEVTIGVLAFRSKAETAKEWSETIAYLNRVEPKYHFQVVPLNYGELNDAVSRKDIDFVITNSGHYVELEKKFRISRIATMIKYKNGQWIDHFGGVIFTLSNRRDIQTLEDLRGKQIASIDAESFGGYAAQMYEFHRIGIKKDDLYIRFLGMPHAKVVHAVINGNVDAGFVRTDVLESLAEKGELDIAKIKILNSQKISGFPYHLSTALYPEWPIAQMPGTDKELTNKVLVALLKRLTEPEHGHMSKCIDWTAPLEYRDIHEIFMALRLPPYDIVRDFEWHDVYSKYKWFIGAIGFLIFLLGMAVVVEIFLRKKLQIESRKNQKFLQMSADGIHILNTQGYIILCSDKFSNMLGYSKHEMNGMHVSQWDPHFSNSEVQLEIKKLQPHETKSIQTSHQRKDGTRYQVELNVSLIRIGATDWVYCSARDITSEMEQKLHDKQAALVFESSSDAIMITDEEGHIIQANPAFEILTGYGKDEWFGQDTTLFKSGMHDALFYQNMWEAITASGYWEGEIINQNKSGDLFHRWLTIRALSDDNGKVTQYIAIFSEITDQKEIKRQIWHQSSFDQLTGFFNRNMLIHRLEKYYLNQKIKIALLHIDLDNFKEINDTFGHDGGDKIIREAAERITKFVRKKDIVARFGGDEFILIRSSVQTQEEIEELAKNVLEQLSYPFYIQGVSNHLSASIGIAISPTDGSSSENLIKHAEQALYTAKKSGRNQYQFFTSEIQALLVKRSHLLRNLREAIKEKEFELYYQPIMNLHSGKIEKAEALIRWNSKDGQVISPADFIPLAEESGLITEMGEWIFEEAVRQIRLWRQYNPIFQISINKSPLQFKSGTDSSLVRYMESSHLSSDAIVVEITEGVLMDNNTTIQARLEQFKRRGIQVALDDFGTGYSSLAYLKKFDIDYVKIDREFIKNLEENDNDKYLCEAIIAMSHKLGILVIAEGIETYPQKEFLRMAGCDYIQGYLISKPLPAAEFEAKFISQKPLN